jgi:putative ABC transport system substrate-binding protein
VRRRKFVALVGGAVLAGPARASAQSTVRSYRLGWLGSTDESFTEPYSLAFVQRLGELGFVEGPNLTIERLHADGKLERLPALAAELAKLKCDVFFGAGLEANWQR